MPTENHRAFQRSFFIYDPKHGKYLVKAKYPSEWTSDVEKATRYSSGVIVTLKKHWKYLDSCEIRGADAELKRVAS